jgi:transposase
LREQNPGTSERNAEMVRLFQTENLSLQALGDRYGVTRQRAEQILQQAGIDTGARYRERMREAREAKAEQRRRWATEGKPCRFCGELVASNRRSRGLHFQNNHGTKDIGRDAAVAADYAAGMLQREIMEKHDIAASAVLRAVKRNGVPMRRPNTARLPSMAESLERKKAIIEAAQSGQKLVDIARQFGVSLALVSLFTREARRG